MPRVTPFSAGQRWHCDRGAKASYDRPSFWFVVLGPAQLARANETKDAKLCLMEPDWRRWSASAEDYEREFGPHNRNGRLGVYSTKHLRRHGVQEELSAETLDASSRACGQILARIQPVLSFGLDRQLAGKHDESSKIFRLAEALTRKSPQLDADQQKLLAQAERFGMSCAVDLANIAAGLSGDADSAASAAPAPAKRRIRL